MIKTAREYHALTSTWTRTLQQYLGRSLQYENHCWLAAIARMKEPSRIGIM